MSADLEPGRIVDLCPREDIVHLYRSPLNQDAYELMAKLGGLTNCQPEFRIKLGSNSAEIHLPGWRIDFYPDELRGYDYIAEFATRIAAAIRDDVSGWNANLPRARLWRTFND